MKKILILALLLIFGFFIPKDVLADETLLVTASVRPTSDNINLTLTSSRGTELLNEGDNVTFTVSYRSASYDAYPFTLTVYWDKGIIEDSSGNTLDIYDYLLGSASKTDNGITPTVDLQNNQISWSIPSLGSSTAYHTVDFIVRVKSLPTDKQISVDTHANGIFDIVVIPEVLNRSHIKRQPEKFPTNIPGPTQPLATPIPKVLPLIIRSIDIRSITNNSLLFDVVTGDPAYLTVYYGFCDNPLTQNIESNLISYSHRTEIPGLQADTAYCFQILAKDVQKNRLVWSDRFKFLTAKEKERFKIIQEYVSWDNLPLNFNTLGKMLVPPKEIIVVTVVMEETQTVKKIVGKFVSRLVLGASTLSTAHIGEVRLSEVSRGVFAGEIATPSQIGEYDFQIQVSDDNNAFTQKKLSAVFLIVSPLKIVDLSSGKPIENAQVTIYRFEESAKRYVSLQESFFLPQTENGVIFPYRSNEKGEVNIGLPEGRYQFDIAAVGYEDAQGSVYLGVDDLVYPTIKMNKQPSLIATATYLSGAMQKGARVAAFNINRFFSTKLVFTILLCYEIMTLLFTLLAFFIEEATSDKEKKLLGQTHEPGDQSVKRKVIFDKLIIEELITLIQINLTISVLVTVAFVVVQGFFASWPFIIISFILLVIWFFGFRKSLPEV
ncbi:hypothetical protein A2966_03460 [Candidatus Roizmanbacteria bacterium RIFCSPLOWO2_01_FULL_41_22]|uniref:Fibronectin type-III domain-containing protein n=2 Tax=Candidatus Roizmaniibacteriota TaxID=1752723 RepID=A0A1F7JS45_9BACT|nr:MAG: hypothetical protein A2966_03460 [Candidatus Roizmanbacteria bacterium RIFCSPLOWO2_01_FULL_41_22]OGK58391.1 MAG: hypothetical protein A3H86_02485 [Candidatus Roizmanbacteria bacterium RIFCSPLOWO2_02_FULL_41_9]